MARDNGGTAGATAHPTNNFDLLRLFAALLVLWSHAHSFYGKTEPVLLSWATLGPVGLFIFFIISGYLVSISWEADPNIGRFLARRALRLFPALAVVTLLSMLVLGPFLTTLPLSDYFGQKQFYKYLLNAAFYPVYALPGVFEHMRVSNAVNGSLWSLPVEYLMYLCVAVAGLARLPRWVSVAVFVALCIGTVTWALVRQKSLVFYAMDLRQVVICGAFFAAGVCVQRFRLEPKLTLTGVCFAFVAMLCVERWPEISRALAWIAIPYLVLAFGLARSAAATVLARLGDWSYGVYIYAFPIQQSVLYLVPDIAFPVYVAVSAVLTLACGAASWHLIEKRALAHKPKRPRPIETVVPAAAVTP